MIETPKFEFNAPDSTIAELLPDGYQFRFNVVDDEGMKALQAGINRISGIYEGTVEPETPDEIEFAQELKQTDELFGPWMAQQMFRRKADIDHSQTPDF